MKPEKLYTSDMSRVLATGRLDICLYALHHKAWLAANGFVLRFDDGHLEYVPKKFWDYKIVGMYFRKFL